jgi:hypothetical protein
MVRSGNCSRSTSGKTGAAPPWCNRLAHLRRASLLSAGFTRPRDGPEGVRWGAEVNNGRISARNLPPCGCVFSVDLPRLSVVAVA